MSTEFIVYLITFLNFLGYINSSIDYKKQEGLTISLFTHPLVALFATWLSPLMLQTVFNFIAPEFHLAEISHVQAAALWSVFYILIPFSTGRKVVE